MPRPYTRHTAEERTEKAKTKLAYLSERLGKTNLRIERLENIKDSILERMNALSTKLEILK